MLAFGKLVNEFFMSSLTKKLVIGVPFFTPGGLWTVQFNELYSRTEDVSQTKNLMIFLSTQTSGYSPSIPVCMGLMVGFGMFPDKFRV